MVFTIKFWSPADVPEAASRSAFSEAQLVPEDIQWFGLYDPRCGRGDVGDVLGGDPPKREPHRFIGNHYCQFLCCQLNW